MKCRILIFCFVIVVTGCKTRYVYLSEGNRSCESLKNEFITSTLTCSDQLIVSADILKYLSEKLNEDYTLSKKNEEFNTTDIRVYPNKRMIFNGVRSDSKFGFLYFEKGGLAMTYNLILYKIIDKKIYITQIWINKKYETIDSLKESAKNAPCF